jgi:LPS sulfotransferase NodH
MEYMVLVIIVIGALIASGAYFKRGLQGRWKNSADELGDQYDPTRTNSSIIQSFFTNSVTVVSTENSINGFWTFRRDYTNSIETKSGFMAVGSY